MIGQQESLVDVHVASLKSYSDSRRTFGRIQFPAPRITVGEVPGRPLVRQSLGYVSPSGDSLCLQRPRVLQLFHQHFPLSVLLLHDRSRYSHGTVRQLLCQRIESLADSGSKVYIMSLCISLVRYYKLSFRLNGLLGKALLHKELPQYRWMIVDRNVSVEKQITT